MAEISPGDIATALKNRLEGEDIVSGGQECYIVEVNDHGEELVIAVEDEHLQVGSFLIGISKLIPGPTPQRQTADLQKVLVEEFGGPTDDETAIGMAIRLLREQKNAKDAATLSTAAELEDFAWRCLEHDVPGNLVDSSHDLWRVYPAHRAGASEDSPYIECLTATGDDGRPIYWQVGEVPDKVAQFAPWQVISGPPPVVDETPS